MHSLSFCALTIISLLGGLALALPYAPSNANVIRGPAIKSSRSTNTCADPSLAEPLLEGFDAAAIMHGLNFRSPFETDNTETGAVTWSDIHPVFNAWPTQQDFTSPLFHLTSLSETESIYVIGVNATTPPVVSGFKFPSIIAWVYDTQVCGSVPLMSAAFPSATDTYYTASSFVHSGLIAAGWVDAGVVAFVLPLSNS